MATDTPVPSGAPAACEICGRAPRPGDRFCSVCGALLPGGPRPPVSLPASPPGYPVSPLATLSFATVVVIAAILFFAPFFFPPRKSRLQEALIPAPSPLSAPPARPLRVARVAPPTAPPPRHTPARFVSLSPAETAQAAQELQTLLGPLYYPGAIVPGETIVNEGRTFREGDRRTRSLYPSVVLEPPDADAVATLETVTAYYERLLPQGRRLPEGGFRADDVPRPGDGVRTRVLVFRARQPAGRVRVMLMTFR